MKYDDAAWHYEGDFPSTLPTSAGATHIAMFVAWAVLNGLAGDLHVEDFIDDLDRLKSREISPGEWFLTACDGKFTDEDLSAEGNAFALAYYRDPASSQAGPIRYSEDYAGAFPICETLYHVPDTWATYATVVPIINHRFARWRGASGSATT